MEEEVGRAAIWEVDAKSGASRLSPRGCAIRTASAWEPRTGALWTVVNERDELGSDLVPDYLTSVRDGGFYGWPYSYFGANVDKRVEPQRPDLVAKAIKPDYALGTHVASLGLAFSENAKLPRRSREGCSSASTARGTASRRAATTSCFVPFRDGKPSGPPIEVLTGFSARRARPTGGRWAWRSTSAARCSSRTTSATSSGAYPSYDKSVSSSFGRRALW